MTEPVVDDVVHAPARTIGIPGYLSEAACAYLKPLPISPLAPLDEALPMPAGPGLSLLRQRDRQQRASIVAMVLVSRDKPAEADVPQRCVLEGYPNTED